MSMNMSTENTKLLQYKQLSIEVAAAEEEEEEDSHADQQQHDSSLSSYPQPSLADPHENTIREQSQNSFKRFHLRLTKYFQSTSYTSSLLHGCFLLGFLMASLHLLQLWRHAAVEHHHVHILPTVLSVRNNATGTGYVNSIDNFLYNEMKTAKFDVSWNNKNKNDDKNKNSLDQQQGEKKYNMRINKDVIEFHDDITVSWDYTKARDSDSVMALYCPAASSTGDDYDQFNPHMFVDAATKLQIQSTMLAQNLITDELTLDNMNYWTIPSFPIIKEDSCEFRLWSREETTTDGGNILVYHLLDTTGPIPIQNGSSLPTALHLALTDNKDEMLVHFSTGGGNDKSQNGNKIPMVLYGMGGKDLNVATSQFNFGSTTTYHASDMCQSPANLQEPGKFSSPHLLHSVTMVDLEPDSRYYYKVGLLDRDEAKNMLDFEDQVVWSDVNSFQSPLSPGMDKTRDGKPLTLIVYADQGISGYGNEDDGDRIATFTQREVEENGIRVVHHFGDLSYAQGASHIWDIWLDMVSRFATSVPLMVGVGNHEYDHVAGGGIGRDPSGVITSGGYNPEWGNFGTDSNGECGVPTSKRFVMPANGNGVYWYSYDYGLVHTIMLSSEHDISPGSEQYLWLEMNLSSVNRTLTPWVILEAHRPMYMIEDIAPNTQIGIHMRQHFEELLQRYHVDLYLAGHYHAYFRSCPGLYKSRCNNGGLTHITIGTAGAELDSVPLLRKPWSAYFSAEWGYGRITVANATALLFEFVSDEDGLTKDSTWLFK